MCTVSRPCRCPTPFSHTIYIVNVFHNCLLSYLSYTHISVLLPLSRLSPSLILPRLLGSSIYLGYTKRPFGCSILFPAKSISHTSCDLHSSTTMASKPTHSTVSSDEINFLVFRYLQESGMLFSCAIFAFLLFHYQSSNSLRLTLLIRFVG